MKGIKCLVCGKELTKDDLCYPVQIKEELNPDDVMYGAVVHQTCFDEYDSRIMWEDWSM